jgi:autotransporter-associated beta strand protein
MGAIGIIAGMRYLSVSGAVALILSLGALSALHAGSATWRTNPSSNDWNTAANWMPRTVPNGTDDVATFGVSAVTDITQSTTTTLGGMQFDPGASSYNIDLLPSNLLSINDAGVTNQSSVTQSINCFSTMLDFYNQSTAGDNVIYTSTNTTSSLELITFHDNATAGTATFINNDNPVLFQNSIIEFIENASAGSSFITNNGGCCSGFAATAYTIFADNSSAADSTIIYEQGASGYFSSQATAANSTITCSALTSLYFFNNSTAADATITCSSDSTVLYFQDSTSAGAATITCSAGSTVSFDDHATAGAATFTADASTLHFQAQSDGAAARIILSNAGNLIVGDKPLVFNLGSLEGDVTTTATINRVTLIGGNNLDATFSGTLESSVEGDWLTKVGTGTWTIAGLGSYPGSTTVTAGALLVTSASTPTGTGPVKVNAGTLGGSGTIAGPVTIGTGSGTGAFLAPAFGGNKQHTLTIQSNLTFNSDATYTYTFKAKGSKSKIDKVVANGLTINSGAMINLSGTVQGQLTQGTVLTLIKNTAASPISGTFANLPDGGIVTINGNNFQANYEGGDGNDLTLTAVP